MNELKKKLSKALTKQEGTNFCSGCTKNVAFFIFGALYSALFMLSALQYLLLYFLFQFIDPNVHSTLVKPWAFECPPYSWIFRHHWLIVTYFIIGLLLSYSSQQLIFLDSSTCTLNLEQRSKYMNIKQHQYKGVMQIMFNPIVFNFKLNNYCLCKHQPLFLIPNVLFKTEKLCFGIVGPNI